MKCVSCLILGLFLLTLVLIWSFSNRGDDSSTVTSFEESAHPKAQAGLTETEFIIGNQVDASNEGSSSSYQMTESREQDQATFEGKREALILSYDAEMSRYVDYSLAEQKFAEHKWRIRNQAEIEAYFDKQDHGIFNLALHSNQ